MACRNWRRVNENNVDLNRNALFRDLKLEEVLRRDPNIAGYEDFAKVLNPQYSPSSLSDIKTLLAAGQVLASSNSAAIKRAMVTGTYSNPKGIFFGGFQLQPSHHAVQSFLKDQGYVSRTKKLVVIDVHTGLGPFGRDTLMMNEHLAEAFELFAKPNTKIREIEWEAPFALELQSLPIGEGNIASEGYDLTTGDVQSQYHELFENLDSYVALTQEFGTYSGVFVAVELVRENQAFHFGSANDKIAAGRRLKDVFCPDSQSFAASVIRRGILMVLQSL